MATAIDPICKMEVDTDIPGGGQSEHQGTTYYFCAPGCKVAFDKEPEKYLSGGGDAEHDHHGHDHGHDHGHPHQEAPPQRGSFISRLFGRGG